MTEVVNEVVPIDAHIVSLILLLWNILISYVGMDGKMFKLIFNSLLLKVEIVYILIAQFLIEMASLKRHLFSREIVNEINPPLSPPVGQYKVDF